MLIWWENHKSFYHSIATCTKTKPMALNASPVRVSLNLKCPIPISKETYPPNRYLRALDPLLSSSNRLNISFELPASFCQHLCKLIA